MPVPTHHSQPSSPPMDEPPPSPSTVALLSLSQDITALISLSLEATASLVHDWVKHTLSSIGLASSSALILGPRRSTVQGERGRGMAVVVVGASDATGQSLTLHLAKAGYTVFPFVPLPSPDSPPTSTALSTLLLTWSGIQKRLRARNPNHAGTVVPVLTDPEGDVAWRDIKGKGRFRHAGETVRAYCRENNLVLISIVCASRSSPASTSSGMGHHGHGQRHARARSPVSIDRTPRAMVDVSPTPLTGEVSLPLILPPPLSGLAATDETTLLGLYRANVLDPLSVLRELSDLLSCADLHGRGRGRVVFVNSPQDTEEDLDGALQMIGKARGETARLLRGELGRIGVDVCEVVVGPMAPRTIGPGYHIRQDSGESNESHAKLVQDGNEEQEEEEEEEKVEPLPPPPKTRDDILASRLAFLSRIWAVDDALLFSAVRRAIEDQYPRYRHHAGLSPLLGSLADATPGGGLVRAVGRWVLGRLLKPRSAPT